MSVGLCVMAIKWMSGDNCWVSVLSLYLYVGFGDQTVSQVMALAHTHPHTPINFSDFITSHLYCFHVMTKLNFIPPFLLLVSQKSFQRHLPHFHLPVFWHCPGSSAETHWPTSQLLVFFILHSLQKVIYLASSQHAQGILNRFSLPSLTLQASALLSFCFDYVFEWRLADTGCPALLYSSYCLSTGSRTEPEPKPTSPRDLPASVSTVPRFLCVDVFKKL